MKGQFALWKSICGCLLCDGGPAGGYAQVGQYVGSLLCVKYGWIPLHTVSSIYSQLQINIGCKHLHSGTVSHCCSSHYIQSTQVYVCTQPRFSWHTHSEKRSFFQQITEVCLCHWSIKLKMQVFQFVLCSYSWYQGLKQIFSVF